MNEPIERALYDVRFELPVGLIERAKRGAFRDEIQPMGTSPDHRNATGHWTRRPGRRERLDPDSQTHPFMILVAAALAIAVVLTLVLASRALNSRSQVPVDHGPSPNVPAPTPRMPSAFDCAGYQPGPSAPIPAKPVSPTSIWGHGGLLSLDAGVHWRDMSPAALRQDEASNLPRSELPPGFADFYLDGEYAWLARLVNLGSMTSCYDHIVVFQTADGGHTWQQSIPIAFNSGGNPLASPFPCTLPVLTGFSASTAASADQPSTTQAPSPTPAQCPSHFGVGVWLSFIDSRSGWLVAGNSLYSTSDGGHDWSPAPQSQFKGCHFVATSRTTWWCGLSRTQDGGATWTHEKLPCACTTSPDDPVFFDQSMGLVHTGKIVNTATSETDTYGLYRTTDGGNTWRELSVPFGLYVFAIDYTDPHDLWVIANPPAWIRGDSGPRDWLYHSADGGTNWTLVQKDTPIGYSWPGQPMMIWFVDSTHGFVVQVDQVTGAYPQLLVTRDGGHSWQVVHPAVPAKAST